jgi:AcrR family transcriptional regulator
MSATRTARDRARQEITLEITQAARRHLAEKGAAALSLRAVARDLEMAPSALYRYFPSRDALLTALIIEAYDSIADHVEQAVGSVPAEEFLPRWRAACRAVRGWAHTHPHEYALIYGSPVPGYAAPQETIPSGSRIPLLLLALVKDAWIAGALTDTPTHPALPEAVAEQANRLADAIHLGDLPRPLLLRAVAAWTQLFGAVSLELFGQLKGAFTDDTPVFTYAVDVMAHSLGFHEKKK